MAWREALGEYKVRTPQLTRHEIAGRAKAHWHHASGKSVGLLRHHVRVVEHVAHRWVLHEHAILASLALQMTKTGRMREYGREIQHAHGKVDCKQNRKRGWVAGWRPAVWL